MANPTPDILVVDDDELMLEFAMAAVNRLGYVAVGRTNVEAAMAVLKTTPSLQLVLSDVCLKSSTGPDLVRQALRDRPELKVVFMTGGYADIAFRRTDPVLSKPFDLDRLRKALDNALHPSESVSEHVSAANERRRRIA